MCMYLLLCNERACGIRVLFVYLLFKNVMDQLVLITTHVHIWCNKATKGRCFSNLYIVVLVFFYFILFS